jgi:hypothetical protein
MSGVIRRRASRVCVSLLLFACRAEQPAVLVPPDGAKSAIFIAASEEIAAIAIDLEGGMQMPTLLSIAERRIAVLFFAQDLSSLDLDPGEIPLPPEGRRFPESLETRTASFDGERLTPWITEVRLPEWLEPLRLPHVSLARCASKGGCADSVAPGICKFPCKEPLAPIPPNPIREAAFPRFLPCPEGWSLEEDEISLCRPDYDFPCASPGEAAAPRGCVPIGECTGEWPSNLPAGARIAYVSAAPGASGDGSRMMPFRRIEEALALAAPGSIVALSTGVFTATIAIPPGVEIAGACARETILEGSASLLSGRAALRDLGLRSAQTALRVDGGELMASRVIVELTGRAAIAVANGATLEGRQIYVFARQGEGLVVEGFVRIEGLTILRGNGVGVAVRRSARADLSNVAIRAFRGAAGAGLEASGASVLTGREILIQYGEEEGLSLSGTASVAVDALFIAGPRRDGIIAKDASRLTASRTVIFAVPRHGIRVEAAAIRLEDALILGDDQAGVRPEVGVSALGGRLTLARTLLLKTTRAVDLDGSELQADDLSSADSSGPAISAEQSIVTLARATLKKSRIAAIDLHRGRFDAEDLFIQDTAETSLLVDNGHGLQLTEVEAVVSRAVIDDVDQDSLRVLGRTSSPVRFTDLNVSEATRGLFVSESSVRIERAAISTSPTCVRVESSAELELVEARIVGQSDSNPDKLGLSASSGATVSLDRFAIQGVRTGAEVSEATLTLKDGLVEYGSLGIDYCPNAPEDAFSKLADAVIFRGPSPAIGCAP